MPGKRKTASAFIPGNTISRDLLSFYKGKRVFLTGHTGFKGSWMTKILLDAGAQVCGYSLKPPTNPNLFTLAELEAQPGLEHHTGDVCDLKHMKEVFGTFRPEIVIHMAAQPIVRDSYRDPRGTYETNVMGTVNILECVRLSVLPKREGGMSDRKWDGVRSFLNVTTDKVYKNNEWYWGYREDEPLDGYDPYSNSKSCSELVTHAYKNSYFRHTDTALSTARAGNVIGGGDFANDRIIPDCVRAIVEAKEKGKTNGEIIVRNMNSIRPYQHVLDPLFAYLMIAAKQYEDESYSGYYNVGPDESECATTGYMVIKFMSAWNDLAEERNEATFSQQLPVLNMKHRPEENAPHESNFLKLDCSKLKSVFNWSPVWGVGRALEETAMFTKAWLCGQSVLGEMEREIELFV
ncbi:MAG: CDP-glucose 4,6-dehydratase [Lachnospiraceae bacterium]|nr:CDP-glucose 4,6-dehydratase [Lachnospiraceae bacterium]